MTHTKILEEDRRLGSLTTLEKAMGDDDMGGRYRVKSVRIRSYGSEETARRAYEQLKKQRGLDTAQEPSEATTGRAKQGKAKTQAKSKTDRRTAKNGTGIKKRKASD